MVDGLFGAQVASTSQKVSLSTCFFRCLRKLLLFRCENGAVALRCQKDAGLTAVLQVLRECVWCFSFTVPMHRCLNLTVLAQWVRQKGTRARTLKQRRSHLQFHMQVSHGAREVYFLLVQDTHFPEDAVGTRGVLDAVARMACLHLASPSSFAAAWRVRENQADGAQQGHRRRHGFSDAAASEVLETGALSCTRARVLALHHSGSAQAEHCFSSQYMHTGAGLLKKTGSCSVRFAKDYPGTALHHRLRMRSQQQGSSPKHGSFLSTFRISLNNA